jgi:para-aminobenzoate synthetase
LRRDPDAAFFFVDRFLVVDHLEGDMYIMAVHSEESAETQAAQAWISSTADRIKQFQLRKIDSASHESINGVSETPVKGSELPVGDGGFQSSRSKSEYISDIRACMEALYSGNSYEICLTNMLTGHIPAHRAWQFYKYLRTVNAAPYSAWMNFGQVCIPAVYCSSAKRLASL